MLKLAYIVSLLNLTYIIAVAAEPSPALFAGVGEQSNSPALNIKPQNANAVADNHDAETKIKLEQDPFSGSKNADRKAAAKSTENQPNEHPPNAQPIPPVHREDLNQKVKDAQVHAPKQPSDKNHTSENKVKDIIDVPFRPNSKEDIVQSGALLRGFYVFLGLSVLTMMYFIFRSYRLRRGSQPSSTVRKYGVTARRSDMEMRPLELEEEDDDTLFEISNHSVNR